MDKLGERIGLYDFWVVFFPGIIGVLELILYAGTFWSLYKNCSFFFIFNCLLSDNISEWILILIASVFTGIILQEMGRLLCKAVNFSNASKLFLNPIAGIFSRDELRKLRQFLAKYGWNGNDIDVGNEIFNQINTEAQECGLAARYVKLNVIQKMSVSLSVAMILGSIGSVVLFAFGIMKGRMKVALFMLFVCLCCLLASIVFYKRFKRFNLYWVRNIIYGMSRKKNAERENNNGNT